jgi:NADH:ubiquinone oxidoreductase subunit E
MRRLDKLIEGLTEKVGAHGQDSGGATWEPSPCLWQCDRAPAAFLA